MTPAPATRILVVTPSYNQASFLSATLDSIVPQISDRDGYVVADGDSGDGSVEILRLRQSELTDVLWGPDEGQSDAITAAALHGVNQFVDDDSAIWFNWINSDDLLTKDCLETLRQTAKLNPDADAIAFDVEAFNGDVCYTMPNRGLTAKAMLRDDGYRFAQPGLWLRWDQVSAIGGIDRSLQYGFDWDLTVRYLSRFPNVVYTKQIGARFRLHEQSKTMVESRKNDRENQFEREHDRIREKLAVELPARLGRLSIVGGRRRRWHQRLASLMDDLDRSPLESALVIAVAVGKDPLAAGSRRTFGSILRLLSRYVRPRSSWDRT